MPDTNTKTIETNPATAPNPGNNPVITDLNRQRQANAKAIKAAKKTGKLPTAKTAAQQLVVKKSEIEGLRKVMRNSMKPSVANIEAAITNVSRVSVDLLRAENDVAISKQGALADAYSDLAYFMMHDPNANGGKVKIGDVEITVPALVPDFTASRQLVSFVSRLPDMKKVSAGITKGSGAEDNIIRLETTTLSAELKNRKTLAAKMALLLCHPKAGVRHGFRKAMPNPNEMTEAQWEDAPDKLGNRYVRAYCVQERIIYPRLTKLDPTKPVSEMVIVDAGENTSTALRCLTAKRVNLLYDVFFGNKDAKPQSTGENGRPATWELYLPRATRTPASGTGASATAKSAGFAVRDNMLAMALILRDGKRADWGELVEPATQASILALATELVNRIGADLANSKAKRDAQHPGFDLVQLANVINSRVLVEGDTAHVLDNDGKRAGVIGAHGSSVLPDPKPQSQLRKTA